MALAALFAAGAAAGCKENNEEIRDKHRQALEDEEQAEPSREENR
jgi:hypothetical protein